MDAAQQDMFRRILTECRVLSLAVTVDDAPYAGLLPFAMRPDFGALNIGSRTLAEVAGGA